jgi:DNA-directed RNA polymerase specialized sigma24 family protein
MNDNPNSRVKPNDYIFGVDTSKYREIDAFVRRILQKIYFYSLSKEDWEDLYQEITLGVLEGAAEFSPDKSQNRPMYLWHKGLFKGLDWWRNRCLEQHYDESFDFRVDPDDPQANAEYLRILDKLDKADPGCKYIVVRHFGLDGNPPATLRALSNELGIPRGTVFWKIHNILEALQ